MIDDDLRAIRKLQQEFKRKNGAYFEMSMKDHDIEIPKEDDVLNMTKIKRFFSRSDDTDAWPAPDEIEIEFVPTAKNWKFIIGRGIQVDEKTRQLVKDSWYCKAQQLSMDGKELSEEIIQGGDENIGGYEDD